MPHRMARILLLIGVTALLMACREQQAPTMSESFNQAQIRKQTNPPHGVGPRPLAFGPFEASLAALDVARLDRLLIDASVADMVQMQRNGDISSAELTTYYLHNIAANQHLNAVIELNPEALSIAAQRDQMRIDGQPLPTLHGVPILLKDNIGTGDQLHTTAGAKALESAHADRDAFIVTQLREAGAVILGKTNLSEWANFMTSDSSNGFSALGGQTRHPLGPFDVSGSSSGSAAAVAARLAPLAIGSETSGSLVSPASQNGIVTLKPTLGFVSRDRIIPITAALDTAGPMGRSVGDIERLMAVIAARDRNDASTMQAPPFEVAPVRDSLAGVQFGLVRNTASERGGEDAIVAAAVARLEDAGATVVAIDFPTNAANTLNYYDLLLYGMQYHLPLYLAQTDAPVRSVAEIVAFNQQDLAHRAPYGQDLLARSAEFEMSPVEYEQLVASQRRTAAAIIDKLMTQHDVQLLLTLGNHFTRVYAPAGYPALTINGGFRPSGEPLGVTLVGKPFTDAEMLAIGAVFEATP